MAWDLGTHFLAERYNHAPTVVPAVVRPLNRHLGNKPRLLDGRENMRSLKIR